jgi:hypothetical protein
MRADCLGEAMRKRLLGVSIRPAAAALALLAVAGIALVVVEGVPGLARNAPPDGPMHYTVNHGKVFTDAMKVGFNLADVSSTAALDALPDGVRGILWLRNGYNTDCSWQREDAEVVAIVQAAKDNPRFSGIYYISDTPHPSICPDAAERIAERTALIHKEDPNGKTFIAVSGGDKFPEEYHQLANAADYIGVTVYPCNIRKPACDMKKIDQRVGRALDAGIPRERLVPILQAFGQACTTNDEPYYRLPSVEEARQILATWDRLLPPATRPFDMTYSWGDQERHACPSLAMADGNDFPDLRSVYAEYFRAMPE